METAESLMEDLLLVAATTEALPWNFDQRIAALGETELDKFIEQLRARAKKVDGRGRPLT